MTWTEALESLAAHPHLWRFRQLCDEGNPNAIQRDKYRGLVIRMATNQPLESPDAIITRVEAMAARALSGERGGGCGGCP